MSTKQRRSLLLNSPATPFARPLTRFSARYKIVARGQLTIERDAQPGKEERRTARDMREPIALTYDEIMRMPGTVLEPLAITKLLDEATLARINHLSRFFGRIGQLGAATAKVRAVVTDEEAQAIWRQTADPSASDTEIGRHPLNYPQLELRRVGLSFRAPPPPPAGAPLPPPDPVAKSSKVDDAQSPSPAGGPLADDALEAEREAEEDWGRERRR